MPWRIVEFSSFPPGNSQKPGEEFVDASLDDKKPALVVAD
jgi:hypothetical protein